MSTVRRNNRNNRIRRPSRTRGTTTSGNVLRPTPVVFNDDNLSSIISDENMRSHLPYQNGEYFQMVTGQNAPQNFSGYDYKVWDATNNTWSPFEGDDKHMEPGYYIRTRKQSPSGTSGTSGTTTYNTFNGLDLGFTAPQQPAATSPYNYSWYNTNRNNLSEYQDLGKNYNEAIKNRNLDFASFQSLQKFLNPDIYKGMDANNDNSIDVDEYNKFLETEANKAKFYNSFSNNSWLNPTAKEYYTFFKDKKGLDKIQAYNDYMRLLYGQDLEETTQGDNNAAAINYLINETPASPGDDKYKLGKAYNEALQRGDIAMAKRLSLYMNQQGINHYGYNDHFDLGHQQGRWNRKLSNGQTVGQFLDWIYEQNKEKPLDSQLLYDIIRKTTKWNFDLNDNFWNSLGDRAKAYDLKNKYAQSHQPNFKEGGQIFRMLFV